MNDKPSNNDIDKVVTEIFNSVYHDAIKYQSNQPHYIATIKTLANQCEVKLTPPKKDKE